MNFYSGPAFSPTTLGSGIYPQIFVAFPFFIPGETTSLPPINTPSKNASLRVTVDGLITDFPYTGDYDIWDGSTYKFYATTATITRLINFPAITASGSVYTINPGYVIDFIGQF
jgi:hypothetical protein